MASPLVYIGTQKNIEKELVLMEAHAISKYGHTGYVVWDNLNSYSEGVKYIHSPIFDPRFDDYVNSVNVVEGIHGVVQLPTPPAQARISVSPINFSQNDTLVYSLVLDGGIVDGALDILVDGDLDNTDFDVDFLVSLGNAVSIKDGVTLTGNTLVFTEDFDGTLTWQRDMTSNPAVGSSHVVKLTNQDTISVWRTHATALCGSPDHVSHPRLFGWNNSGFDFSMTLPPSNWTFDFAVNKGFNVFRLPYKIERTQPDVFGAIDGADAASYKAKVDYALSLGFYVIIDPHNYGGRNILDENFKVGEPEFTTEAYVDHIVKMNAFIGNDPKIIWNLMNEPVGLNRNLWFLAAQSAIDALRAEGFWGDIQVPGTSYSSASSWVSSGNAENALLITDPLNYYSFDVHQYFDPTSAGISGVCSVGAGNRLTAVTSWAVTYNKRLFLGETASGNPNIPANAECSTVFPSVLTMIAESAVWDGIAAWGYGDRWTSTYHYRALQINPETDPDTPYMQMMEEAIEDFI